MKKLIFLITFSLYLQAIQINFENITIKEYIDIYSDISKNYFIYPEEFKNRKLDTNIPDYLDLTQADLERILKDYLTINRYQYFKKVNIS